MKLLFRRLGRIIAQHGIAALRGPHVGGGAEASMVAHTWPTVSEEVVLPGGASAMPLHSRWSAAAVMVSSLLAVGRVWRPDLVSADTAEC